MDRVHNIYGYSPESIICVGMWKIPQHAQVMGMFLSMRRYWGDSTVIADIGEILQYE